MWAELISTASCATEPEMLLKVPEERFSNRATLKVPSGSFRDRTAHQVHARAMNVSEKQRDVSGAFEATDERRQVGSVEHALIDKAEAFGIAGLAFLAVLAATQLPGAMSAQPLAGFGVVAVIGAAVSSILALARRARHRWEQSATVAIVAVIACWYGRRTGAIQLSDDRLPLMIVAPIAALLTAVLIVRRRLAG